MTARATLKLGTRGSDLARTQSTTVADALRAAGYGVELTIIKTAGDRDTSASGDVVGRSLNECTASSIRCSTSACSISRTKIPCAPIELNCEV